jgi:hypothetical protein
MNLSDPSGPSEILCGLQPQLEAKKRPESVRVSKRSESRRRMALLADPVPDQIFCCRSASAVAGWSRLAWQPLLHPRCSGEEAPRAARPLAAPHFPNGAAARPSRG